MMIAVHFCPLSDCFQVYPQMQEELHDLAMSRTFQLVNGVLAAADQAQQLDLAHWRSTGARLGKPVSGDIIDSKYGILGLIGEGGMGSVYRVQHLLLGKEMALKTLSAAALTTDAWQRFQREAQAIAKLTHVNIVQVFDFGIEKGGVPYYTMELLSGQSLAERLKTSGPLTLAEALPVFVCIADALAHAHKLGIVHRDVKPANIFLDQGKSGKAVVKVVDFGIAKLATSQGTEKQAQTDIGLVFGSPLYMSPEQALGAPTDQRTDIYSFGCSLFEVLTGHPPFVGKNAFETITMHVHHKARQLVDASDGVQFGQAAEALVARLMAKDVEERYQTFDQVLAGLTKVAAQTGAADVGMVGKSASDGDLKPGIKQKRQRERLLLENTQDNDEAINGYTRESAAERPASALGRAGLISLSVLALVTLVGFCLYFASASTINKKGKHQTEPPAVASPPGAARPVIYYSVLTGGGGRYFNFPSPKIGYVYLGQNEKQRKPAEGFVQEKPGVPLTFLPDLPLKIYPELFMRFRPDDFDTLNCSASTVRWSNEELKYATTSLQALIGIDLTDANLDGSSIMLINRLRQLRRLEVGSTALTGSDLVHLDRLTDLKFLDMTGLKDLRPAFERLKTGHHLQRLRIEDCGLTAADIEIIAKIKSLHEIDIDGNELSVSALLPLSSLPDLNKIHIKSMKFGPECLDFCRSLKHLKELKVTGNDWSQAEEKLVRAAMPLCDLRMVRVAGRLPAQSEVKD